MSKKNFYKKGWLDFYKKNESNLIWWTRPIDSVGSLSGKLCNGYVRISRLEPVCQIVWQIDLPLKPNF